MDVSEHSFTLGLEEEYLLIDQNTLDLVEAPEQLMADCAARLGDQVSPEFLACQIEVCALPSTRLPMATGWRLWLSLPTLSPSGRSKSLPTGIVIAA